MINGFRDYKLIKVVTVKKEVSRLISMTSFLFIRKVINIEYLVFIIDATFMYLLYRRMRRVMINGRIRSRKYNPVMKKRRK